MSIYIFPEFFVGLDSVWFFAVRDAGLAWKSGM